MALSYDIQPTRYLIGSGSAAATLTASYSGNTKTVSIGGMSQLVLGIIYTPAQNSRVISIKVEVSFEGTNYYYLTTEDRRDGAITIHLREPETFTGTTGGTSYPFTRSYPIAHKIARVSVKEDGSSDFGTVKLLYMSSGK
jgi:hypothetical protein